MQTPWNLEKTEDCFIVRLEELEVELNFLHFLAWNYCEKPRKCLEDAMCKVVRTYIEAEGKT